MAATYTRRIYVALLKDYKPVIDAWKNGGPQFALSMVGFIQSNKTAAEIISLWRNVGQQAAETAWQKGANKKATGRIGRWSKAWLMLLKRYINDAALEKVRQEINATTKKMVLKVLMQGIKEGYTLPQLVEQLSGRMTKVRAKMIVRTETIKATNYGFLTAAEQYPFMVQKKWNSAHDNRVRDGQSRGEGDHRALNEQVKNLMEPFADPHNGDLMMCPGDVTLGASGASVINCRCRITFIPMRDASGNLIMK